MFGSDSMDPSHLILVILFQTAAAATAAAAAAAATAAAGHETPAPSLAVHGTGGRPHPRTRLATPGTISKRERGGGRQE
jgi:hypothetical protein